MKKIFAIALALVMVLSMATAFASPCTSGFSWVKDAAADACGKMTVEVIPYVKVNTACAPYFDYEMSTCAAAVAKERVYYAVKVVIDADLDREWYAAIEKPLRVDLSGMDVTESPDFDLVGIDLATLYDGEKTTLYYNFNDTKWEDADADAFEFAGKNLKSALVENPSKAKVCVSFKSEVANFEAGIVGDYYVAVDYVGADGDTGAMLVVEADEALTKAQIKALAEALGKAYLANDSASMDAVLAAVPNAVGYIFVDGEVAVAGKYTDKCSTSFFKAVGSFLGVEIGTKMDKELIDDNFGWKDEVKSCFTWSKAASAIVDAECVVAIPKTGDASVLAWLF